MQASADGEGRREIFRVRLGHDAGARQGPPQAPPSRAVALRRPERKPARGRELKDERAAALAAVKAERARARAERSQEKAEARAARAADRAARRQARRESFGRGPAGFGRPFAGGRRRTWSSSGGGGRASFSGVRTAWRAAAVKAEK